MSFDRKSRSEDNLAELRDSGDITEEEFETMRNETLADATKKMECHAEGVFSVMPIPLGIADRFVIDGQPRKVVMATYERSVVAAANKAAKMTAETGGFRVEYAGDNVTYGEILYEAEYSRFSGLLCKSYEELYACAHNPRRDYGAVSMGFHPMGRFTVFRAAINTDEAQGGRLVTEIMKKMAAVIDADSGLQHVAAIVSNHAFLPVTVSARWKISDVGPEHAKEIVKMQEWAACDPLRAATHVKGIMNAVDAVCLATGQDIQAVEAITRGADEILSRYTFSKDGEHVSGFLSLPIIVGTVGGATQTEYARRNMRIMGIKNARDLAVVAACAGLAANFAALYALVQHNLYGNLGR